MKGLVCRVKLGREARGEGKASSKVQRSQGFWPRGSQKFPCGPWSLGAGWEMAALVQAGLGGGVYAWVGEEQWRD